MELFIMMPNGEIYLFNEESRVSLLEAMNNQDAARKLRNDESVLNTQERYKVFLPCTLLANYLEICYETRFKDE